MGEIFLTPENVVCCECDLRNFRRKLEVVGEIFLTPDKSCMLWVRSSYFRRRIFFRTTGTLSFAVRYILTRQGRISETSQFTLPLKALKSYFHFSVRKIFVFTTKHISLLPLHRMPFCLKMQVDIYFFRYFFVLTKKTDPQARGRKVKSSKT